MARRKSSVTYPAIPSRNIWALLCPWQLHSLQWILARASSYEEVVPLYIKKSLCFQVPIILITSVLGVESLFRAWAKLAEKTAAVMRSLCSGAKYFKGRQGAWAEGCRRETGCSREALQIEKLTILFPSGCWKWHVAWPLWEWLFECLPTTEGEHKGIFIYPGIKILQSNHTLCLLELERLSSWCILK